MKKYLIIILLLVVCDIHSQKLFNSEPIVRVRIINNLDTLKIKFHNDWMIAFDSTTKLFTSNEPELLFVIDNGKIVLLEEGNEIVINNGKFILQSLIENGTLTIKDVPFGIGWWWQNKEDRIYEGEIHCYISNENKFEVVVKLPLEQYLKGVVPYEIGSNSPLEALKSQAVAARSEAIIALSSKLYSGVNYDLTSDVECQVFGGNGKRNSSTDQAVEETKNLVLSENGKPINAYYASNCGGHSELIGNVWGERPSPESYNLSHFDWEDSTHLDLSIEQNVRDWIFSSPPAFCNPNYNQGLPDWSKNNFRWKREFSFEEINSMTSQGKEIGNFISIKVLNRGVSGRIYHAKFIFEKDSLEIKGELNIRQMFNPPLRSSCFVVDKVENGFTFYGAGWGHGVGMCQSGAIAMANKGYNFEEILKHYYKKAELSKIY